jgi:hypothetical protein
VFPWDPVTKQHYTYPLKVSWLSGGLPHP